MSATQTNYTRFNPREVLAAASDYIALGLGRRMRHQHAIADALDLKTIAYAFAVAKVPRQSFESDVSVMARGMASQEFINLLVDQSRPTVFSSYDAGAREYLSFSSVVEIKDYRPTESRAFHGDLALLESGELSPIEIADEVSGGVPEGIGSVTGSILQLKKYARAALLYRDWLLADDLAAIADLFYSIGAGGAQVEAALISGLLASNPAMPGGNAMYDASNTVSAALDAASLAVAMQKLRTAGEAPGRPLNLSARHLVVSPDLEYAACKLIKDAGLDILVTALAGLPGGRWFLLPDPERHPVVGLLRLRGTQSPLTVLANREFKRGDDMVVQVICDSGTAFLRRTGIVRGGASL